MNQSYFTRTGVYQDRYDYYVEQYPTRRDNVYLDILRCINNVYTTFRHNGLGAFDASNSLMRAWEGGLRAVREVQGFGRAWGHAHQVLDLIQSWRGFVRDIHDKPGEEACAEADDLAIQMECAASTELLAEALESLLNVYLELLPSYVEWTPRAAVPVNQNIVNFLQRRGNNYRRVGDPKFYAYDRVVANICKLDFEVTGSNCKFIYGVGPRIYQHINDYLNNEDVVEQVLEEQMESESDDMPDLVPINVPDVVDDDEPVPDLVEDGEQMPDLVEDPELIADGTESDDEIPELVTADESVSALGRQYIQAAADYIRQSQFELFYGDVHVPFEQTPMPELQNPANRGLAEYLWEGSIEFKRSRLMGRAWAWRRAAETVCGEDRSVRTLISQSATDIMYTASHIGPIMHDVIWEYYLRQVDDVEIPEECPTAIFEANNDEGELQQDAIDYLWQLGTTAARATATLIARENILPQTRADFQSIPTCTPELLQQIFPDNVRNWCNRHIVNWLVECADNCAENTPVSVYRNAAQTIARKVTRVTSENVDQVKYIGPYMAERIRGELWGIVEPTQYSSMRKELNLLRRESAQDQRPAKRARR